MKDKLAVIVLAAGKSTRMKSDIPKVIHPLCGRPVLGYVLDLVSALKPAEMVAVLGYKQELVKKIIPAGIKVAVQKKLLGTADAVSTALMQLKGFQGTVLVLYGDAPLLKKETLKKLLEHHIQNKRDATILAAKMDKPRGYGRIIRDEFYGVCGIVEEKDADEVEKQIKEVNTGVAAFKKESLAACLKLVRMNSRKKEYYLTDIIGILYRQGYLVDALAAGDAVEALGINSRAQLSEADSVMRKRINEEWMRQGVSIIDPQSTFISFGTKIGADTVIYPFTVVERDVKIGKRCAIGPFAHLREGTHLANDATIGNFTEIVRARIGRATFVKHFSYLGDAHIGAGVNIGAGTVTANFDGRKKNHTVIRDHAQIGSDTVIVAPVKIGKTALTGAGAVVIRDVADREVVAGVPARVLRKKG